MHWGVRRYQPYSSGEHGKEVGEADRKRHGSNAKKAAKIAGAAGGVLAVSVAANTPTGRRMIAKAVKKSNGKIPGSAKRLGKEIAIGASRTFSMANKPVRSIARTGLVREGSRIVARSAGTAIGVIATGAAIYAGEEYVRYRYGKNTSDKIIQYGRQPVKKK